ncbi:beta-1,4-galactosyltransferase 1-like isoform X3 [Aquarana catesbeiana]|uniref:beta-1,4-galactosyltransferase 1-like isoform X3 n=1 Tax=Aquarana catesbeiana TaxID=8400 RepID=UPI003CC9C5D6
MDYRKLLTILMCISVLFLLSLKSFYLDKYLENINNKTTNLQNAKELTLCPEMPPNLGPILINLEEDMSFLHTISENPNVQFGGRAIPQLCKALQKIAIIIPYRNREPHLKTWLHYMHPFLQKQQGEYGVYVVEQIEMSTFNRAKLMNVGFTEASKDYDYNCFIFSDVDIIPMDERNLYRCSQNPKHMANSLDKHNFSLFYETAFGGIVAFTKEQFLKVNGFSNSFWGWGREDDELYNRYGKSNALYTRCIFRRKMCDRSLLSEIPTVCGLHLTFSIGISDTQSLRAGYKIFRQQNPLA